MMEQTKNIDILAIETSCDETAAAVVRNGEEALSNVIYSQIDFHTEYGGVVPEIASRKHIEKISAVVEKALADAGKALSDIDAVAVTYGPGLVGPLLVGVSFAKSLAFAAGKPLIGVNHIEGHISANYIEHHDLKPPYMGLIVSGGHSHLIVVEAWDQFRVLGRTVDDAAGECFDKVARAIGLGYPGGPKIDRISKEGNPEAITFPKAKVNGAEYDFSFSGLKSCVLNFLNQRDMARKFAEKVAAENGVTSAPAGASGVNLPKKLKDAAADTMELITDADLAASFQKAVVDVLCDHALDACKRNGFRQLALAGGVASNGGLRAELQRRCNKAGIELFVPSPVLCTDNAVMIGAAAYHEFLAGRISGWDLNANPRLKLGER